MGSTNVWRSPNISPIHWGFHNFWMGMPQNGWFILENPIQTSDFSGYCGPPTTWDVSWDLCCGRGALRPFVGGFSGSDIDVRGAIDSISETASSLGRNKHPGRASVSLPRNHRTWTVNMTELLMLMKCWWMLVHCGLHFSKQIKNTLMSDMRQQLLSKNLRYARSGWLSFPQADFRVNLLELEWVNLSWSPYWHEGWGVSQDGVALKASDGFCWGKSHENGWFRASPSSGNHHMVVVMSENQLVVCACLLWMLVAKCQKHTMKYPPAIHHGNRPCWKLNKLKTMSLS